MLRDVSIRLKMTLWMSLLLLVTVSLTFFSVRFAGETVLRRTIRDYLVGTVEENVQDIRYTEQAGDSRWNIYIPYGEGFLEIDEDYMAVVNNVYTALHADDGTMLYGENPIIRHTVSVPFAETAAAEITAEGTRYQLYDRRLDLALPDGGTLWIRGLVPETSSVTQLREMTRISWIILPVLFLLAVLSGYIAADRMLSPIRSIESTAARISQGDDLKERIPIGKSNDEIGRLAQVFNGMLDRLAHAFEAEKQFTSDVSHELRTPTAVILAQCEYTLEKPRSTAEYEEAMRTVQKQGRRMRTLVSDMLGYTRMDQSAERCPMEETDLSLLAEDMAEQMELLETNGITLTAEITPGLTVQGNPLLLSRLLQNLIGNAYAYGKENGHIWVKLHAEGARPVLSVADDGIGISKEEQEKIFDRFYRSDASRTVQGTGLGLSMVKKIAALHGASVEVDSTPGEGSCFRILFPEMKNF